MAICAWCKKFKNDAGYWQDIEASIKKYSKQSLTHCICNDCAKKEYPELFPDLEKVQMTLNRVDFNDR
jgi:hypothetical protein